MKKTAIGLLIGAALMVVTAMPAAAQDHPKGEVAVTYTYLKDLTYDVKAPVGWSVAPALRLSKWFAIVGDVGGNYKGDYGGAEHAFAGGARFGYEWTKVGIYGQLLAGVAAYDGDTNYIIQSGFGVDFIVTRSLAIRAETGGRSGPYLGDLDNRWRGAFGVVYRIGGTK